MSYRFMRVIVFFDLPMISLEDKREYRNFRKFLLKKGFAMMQESVYSKLALNTTVANGVVSSVKEHKPKDGLVQMLVITEKQYSKVEASHLLLIDSGGQYLEGTTDITRTFVLGDISEEERYWFTKALRGHIRLSDAHFLFGCSGINLDILARGPLWDQDVDYQCGTGHGVGHLLNVHESPNGFRWRVLPHRNEMCVLDEGMITSNEPGVYCEGKFGIRHENEMVVVKGNVNNYGQFMHFEPITFVPFDLDGLDVSLLTNEEKTWLNNYHKEVLEKISPYLTSDEAEWLKSACRSI